MQILPITLGLLAATSVSAAKNLRYAIPKEFKAVTSNCILPANFTVTDFTAYTNKEDASLDRINFEFDDAETNINATCSRDAESKPTGPGGNRYACDNVNISFIYQESGLTLIEEVCSGQSTRFEVSGLISADQLVCTDSATGTVCDTKRTTLTGHYDSFEPVVSKAV
ncbi:hypothetical protein GGS21DRAFT_492584 [Xylaria nigripes]|nr:hypothetical protein GGS21DRAFT_492584 [Xylaria nigripes]